MDRKSTKGTSFILLSGIVNCLLSVAHFIVLYFTYQEYKTLISPEALPVLTDMLLFSLAVGLTLLMIGVLACFTYRGTKRNERWVFIVGPGLALLLISFGVGTLVVIGIDAPIAYIHLFNGLTLGLPLLMNRKLVLAVHDQ